MAIYLADVFLDSLDSYW